MLPSKILQSQERELELESLPAPGESPLSSAVVAKAKDRDDGRGRADLLRGKNYGLVAFRRVKMVEMLVKMVVKMMTFKRGGRGSSPSVGGLKPGNPRPRM